MPTPSRESRRKYRHLSHTADLGLRIYGDSLEELFENAGAALISVLTDRRYLSLTEIREIALEAPDREALLVDWLNRLLYLYDVDAFLGREFEIMALSQERL